MNIAVTFRANPQVSDNLSHIVGFSMFSLLWLFFSPYFPHDKKCPIFQDDFSAPTTYGRALEDVLGELQHEFPWQRVRGKEGLPQGPAINQGFRRGYVIEGVSCGEGLVKKG
jgi:hypothetical protein